MIDVLVVGSGASGVNAAVPLVEAGLRVTMLDYGNEEHIYASLIPPHPFSEIRRSDEQQHRYFLGDDFEGVPLGDVRVGAQLTPPRSFISADTARLLPVASHSFVAMESLARGGLAAGWGAGVFPFSDAELREMPISRADLAPHYQAVAERISVAGDHDDLLPFLGEDDALLPPLELDSNAETLFERYRRRRRRLNARGFFLGRPRLAVSTRRHRGRGPHRYHDMDFWADGDRSVYRPRWTLEELQRRTNFRYLDRRLVLTFTERGEDGVEVAARHADSGVREVHRARALVLAAGTLGSARIVLRSLGLHGTRVPLLCNPYSYAPVVNLNMLGREARDRRHSLAQLTAVYLPRAEGGGMVQTQFYSYRSLLTFKLLNEAPLPYREGLRVMSLLMPLLGILGINHEDRASSAKYCALRPAMGDEPERLEIHYESSQEERARRAAHEKAVLRCFRQLGCWPLRLIRLPAGASIHYAGTLPMRRGGGALTCDAEGRLAGTHAVHVTDGSVFPYLPAKGLTFTMMANANRIATRLARRLTAPPTRVAILPRPDGQDASPSPGSSSLAGEGGTA